MDARFWLVLLCTAVALAALFCVVDAPLWFRVVIYTVAGTAVGLHA